MFNGGTKNNLKHHPNKEKVNENVSWGDWNIVYLQGGCAAFWKCSWTINSSKKEFLTMSRVQSTDKIISCQNTASVEAATTPCSLQYRSKLFLPQVKETINQILSSENVSTRLCSDRRYKLKKKTKDKDQPRIFSVTHKHNRNIV